jgi:peptidoglycan/xylan/chitin deacetylase (PgdA/CDA1 family)
LRDAKSYLKQAALGLFSLAGRLPGSKGLPIILYHSVSKEPSIVSMPATLFREEMVFFKQKQYEVSSLDSLARGIVEEQKPAEKTIVLSFDDGLESLYSDVFPVLTAQGCRATVFLVTGHIGGRAAWYPEESGGVVPPLPILNWTQIREMHRYGIDFQAHTHTHPDLTGIPLSAVAEEALRSKKIIEDRLGDPVNIFCYPNGRYSSDVVSVIRDCGFRMAVTTALGVYRPGDDPLQIKRLGHDLMRVKDRVDVLLVARLLAEGGFVPYVKFKRLLRDAGLVSGPFELTKQNPPKRR